MSTTPTTNENVQVNHPHDVEAIPAPTAGPLIFAFGTTLIFAGLVTSWMVAVVGLLSSVWGIVVWWKTVFPREQMEAIPEGERREIVPPTEATEAQLAAAVPRVVLPLEVHRVSAGIKGGIAGGLAMAILAIAWGYFAHRSVWLPINLLADMVIPHGETQTLVQLAAFSGSSLAIGVAIHLCFSIGVGLLFGVAVPIMPRHPLLFCGLAAPIAWSALIGLSVDIVDPALAQHIEWWWFLASQFAFGLVAGWVVGRSERVATTQYMTPAERVALERNKGGDGT
jgi:hypothetical protein